MAWNPNDYSVDNFMQHPYCFCEQIFGKGQAEEAARILNLYTKYNGRVTAEMLDFILHGMMTFQLTNNRKYSDYQRKM